LVVGVILAYVGLNVNPFIGGNGVLEMPKVEAASGGGQWNCWLCLNFEQTVQAPLVPTAYIYVCAFFCNAKHCMCHFLVAILNFGQNVKDLTRRRKG